MKTRGALLGRFRPQINLRNISQFEAIYDFLSRIAIGLAHLQPKHPVFLSDTKLIHHSSHDAVACKISFPQACCLQQNRSRAIRSRNFLCQRVTRPIETAGISGIDSEISGTVLQTPVLFMWYVVELPYMCQFRILKRIGMLRIFHLMLTLDSRFPIRNNSFSQSVLRSYHRPIILPFHGIHHQTSSHIITVLEGICPRFSFGCFHITALMYTCIRIINVIINQHPCFIRSVKISRTANHLHSVISQCGIEYIIPTVPFIGMTTLKQMSVPFGSGDNEFSPVRRIEYAGRIIFQPGQIDFPFPVRNVFLTVIINKKAGIVQTFVELMHRVRSFRL